MTTRTFPEGFRVGALQRLRIRWRAATGKRLVGVGAHARFGLRRAEAGRDACEHYTRYPVTFVVAGLGFNSYRFSVEWSGIEPEDGEFSRAELDHYKRMCACLENGLD